MPEIVDWLSSTTWVEKSQILLAAMALIFLIRIFIWVGKWIAKLLALIGILILIAWGYYNFLSSMPYPQ